MSEFSSWLHILETCSSTNSWAREQAPVLKHGDVVFTRQQTAGRGQQGRIWYAPSGVLTASFILEGLLLEDLPGLSLVAGLAVIHAVEALVPVLQNSLTLKWPNDVLLKQRKLAGILCESTSRNRASQARVVVGVGLNRAVDFAQAGLETALCRAISLHEVEPPPDELILLEHLRDHLLRVSEHFQVGEHFTDNHNRKAGLTQFLPELRQRDALLGHTITLQQAETCISGEATGIDAEGCLLMQLPHQQVRIRSGHILW